MFCSDGSRAVNVTADLQTHQNKYNMTPQNAGWNRTLHMLIEVPEEVFIYRSRTGLYSSPKAVSVLSSKD